jgi:hypothetical protein
MSWLITGKGVDPDAEVYLQRVEAADAAGLEPAVRAAVNLFVVGCKADGIWNAIKASCILAGARTLEGALVPLVGTAPTNFNFAAGDYDRKTGLVGNGTTKYLNSNRSGSADPQNSKHISVYVSTAETRATVNAWYLRDGAPANGRTVIGPSGSTASRLFVALNSFDGLAFVGTRDTGSIVVNRSSGSEITYRLSGSNTTASLTSQSPVSTNLGVFAGVSGGSPTNARLAFYSIGESLNLALLDARVTDLINAFDAAI